MLCNLPEARGQANNCLWTVVLLHTGAATAACEPSFSWMVALIKTVAGAPGRGGADRAGQGRQAGFEEGQLPLTPSFPIPAALQASWLNLLV